MNFALHWTFNAIFCNSKECYLHKLSLLECQACRCLDLPAAEWERERISSARINPNPFLRPGRPRPCRSGAAATLSEGKANLIRVKRGAQSLPISSDLINPNRVIVFDDKEVFSCGDLIVRSLFHCLVQLQSKGLQRKTGLSIFTVDGHKGLTLMLMEGGYRIPAQPALTTKTGNEWLGYVSDS